VETGGRTRISNEEAARLIRQAFDLTPGGIIKRLDLRRPIYRRTAAYGHFGRNEEGFTWEDTAAAAEELARLAGAAARA
jgi:S-adenosylmethionine synthetase